MEIKYDKDDAYKEIIKYYDNWLKSSLKLPKLGPLAAYPDNMQNAIAKIQELFVLHMKFHYALFNYWIQMSKAHSKALDQLSKQKKEFEFKSDDGIKSYRNVVIDVFDESYTNLFQSQEFATTISEIWSSYSDLIKIFQEFFFPKNNAMFWNGVNTANMDEVLSDIQTMKRDIHNLRKDFDRLMKDEKINVH